MKTLKSTSVIQNFEICHHIAYHKCTEVWSYTIFFFLHYGTPKLSYLQIINILNPSLNPLVYIPVLYYKGLMMIVS